MSLTVEQAALAGDLASKIDAVNSAIASVQDAINSGATLSSVTASGALGSVSAISGATGYSHPGNVPLSTADSGAVLAALLAAYQNALSAYTAQLAAIGQ